MWGPWMGFTAGGLFVVLLVNRDRVRHFGVAVPVLIAAVIAIGIAAIYLLGAVGKRGRPTPDPVRDAAPASGEGKAAAPRDTGGPDPSGVE